MLVHFHSSSTVYRLPFCYLLIIHLSVLSFCSSPSALFLIIYPFHPCRYTGKNFIRNRIQLVGENRYRQVVTKNNRLVAFAAVDVGNVYHTDIHTDIAYISRFLPIHQAVGISTSAYPIGMAAIREGRVRCPIRLYPTVSSSDTSRI